MPRMTKIYSQDDTLYILEEVAQRHGVEEGDRVPPGYELQALLVDNMRTVISQAMEGRVMVITRLH